MSEVRAGTSGSESATDELRRLLDDCGVPWKDYGYENHTWWGEWHAENRPSVNGLFLKVEGVVTPEQAVEATLGRGECHDKNGFDPSLGFECTVCGTMVDEYMVTPMDYGHQEQFRYCPGCGARVWAHELD